MSDDTTTTTAPVTPAEVPAWTETLNDDQKAMVHEKGWKEIGDVLGAIPKEDAWTANLTDMQKGMLESKGFKELGTLVDSYGNLEKLKGVPAEQLVQIPQKAMADDPEAWSAYFSKLGRPEKAEEYDLKFPDGEKADEKLVGWAKDTFHNLGLSKKQGEGFIEKWNEYVTNMAAETTEASKHQAMEAETQLKTKWGLAYAKNKQVAENAAKQFGVDAENFSKIASAMGTTQAVEFFHKVGAAMGEGNFITGDSTQAGLKSPEAAQYEINQLMNDKDFGKKLIDGDLDATSKWDRLHKMAYPQSQA